MTRVGTRLRMPADSPGAGWRTIAGVIFMLGVWCVPCGARADEGQAAEWARLAQLADTVALGVCETAESAWDDEHRFIVTTVRFRATRYFKGDQDGPLTVKFLGGRVGDESMSASHSVALAADEEVVLFLQRSQFGPYFVVTAGERGKLALHVTPGSGALLVGGSMPLEEFAAHLTHAGGAK